MSEQESEFGRGLVICLVKFAEHNNDLQATIGRYRSIGLTDGHAAAGYMNAAGDHLLELEAPLAMKDTPLGDAILSLQADTRRMCDILWDGTVAEVESFQEKVRQVALEIDRYLGLDPDIGVWG